jgi:hypothetical protein
VHVVGEDLNMIFLADEAQVDANVKTGLLAPLRKQLPVVVADCHMLN